MYPSCSACKFDMWMINGVFVCRRCDTAPHTATRRWGPPNTPNTEDGAFTATFRDVR